MEKTGSGVLLALNFRAKEDGGGRAVFSLEGGTFVPESEEEPGPFHWSGYLTNINGEDVPVKSDVPPYLGISNYIEIAPLQTRITAEPGGSISGTVRDENGHPIANADVWANYWQDTGGQFFCVVSDFTLECLQFTEGDGYLSGEPGH